MYLLVGGGLMSPNVYKTILFLCYLAYYFWVFPYGVLVWGCYCFYYRVQSIFNKLFWWQPLPAIKSFYSMMSTEHCCSKSITHDTICKGKEIDSRFVHLMLYAIPLLASYHIINEHVYIFVGRKENCSSIWNLQNLLLLLPRVVYSTQK